MSKEVERLRNVLNKIAEVANEFYSGDGLAGGNGDLADGPGAKSKLLSCTPKQLPKGQLLEAARNAVEINPFNQPEFGPLALAAPDFELNPLAIAVMTAKYWGRQPRTLTVSFMETTPADLRQRIVGHLNAWNRTGGIVFRETSGVGQIRISRGPGGYYSYLGTDVLLIPRNRQTMNLQGFTMSTPESEFRRVVRHEAGHTLGFPHEHMRRDLVARIDREKAYEYFRRTQGWTRPQVDQQVLTPLDERSLMATPADETSIMCYQLPGSITRDGRPIRGGSDINQSDYNFVAEIYPKVIRSLEAYAEDFTEEFEPVEEEYA